MMEDLPKSEFIKGSGDYLKKAAKTLNKLGISQIRTLQDPKGIFCIEYPEFYLIANKYVYKNTYISAQKELIERCKRKNKRLLVYIGEDDQFYLYHPQDILDDHWPNQRGYLEMWNWNYSIGQLVFEERKEDVF